jgi:peptidoglycan/xylan/chitin deacetylase (PgdA/CDA1 family)
MFSRLLPILGYHHIGLRSEPRGHRQLFVSQRRFAQQMDYLRGAGYRCVSLSAAETMLRSEDRGAQATVVLTFDDGYRDFYECAYPILRDHGFGATVFVVTGQAGAVSRWDEGWETPLMGWTELRELVAQGIEIGSHTVSHPRLSQLPEALAARELEQSRNELEQNLGVPALTLAYPFGDYDARVENLVRGAGYRLACSIERGNRHAPAEFHRLKRVPVDERTDSARFHRRLSSIYDFTCRINRYARKLSKGWACRT